MTSRPATPELHFNSFLTYGEVAAFAEELAAYRPDLCRLSSIGKSAEGRELLLLTITDFSSGEACDKPAYLVHGNIHAMELAGSHAALYTARRLLSDSAASGLLRDVVFYILPRINPDGAEYAVSTSGQIRSRTERAVRKPNTIYPRDMNGDGLILTMRQEHPDGTFIADPDEPRLLISRKSDSDGPFYRCFPEGMIHEWDGGEEIFSDGRSMDWNRNWSYDWRPEPEQHGAGDYPFSELEMRRFAEFLYGSSNLFGVLGYHTGPAAVLRPPSTGSDADLDEEDVRDMDDIARLGSEATGLPVIPVVKYRNSSLRDKNLRGHFHNFGYHHLGLFVFEFELGVAKNSAGISTEEQFSAKDEDEKDEQVRRVISWWDKNKDPLNPLFKDWREFDHPQLGKVEIGGILSRTFANPAIKQLEKICEGTYEFTVKHASKHPKLVLEEVGLDHIEGNVYRVRARVANRGEFPTHITNKGKTLARLLPVSVGFYTSGGAKLLSASGHCEIGHLGGVSGSRLLEWFVTADAGENEICSIEIEGGAAGRLKRVISRPEKG